MAAITERRVREGLPHPLGATWDGEGRQLRAVFRACDQGRALPVRRYRRARDRAHRAARVHRRDLARLPAGRAPGHGLRLSRARAVRAGRRPPLQPEQAAARSLRPRPCRRAELGPGGLRLSARNRATTSPSTSATARPSCRNAWSSTRISTGRASPAGSAVPWDHTIIYETHVRGYTKLHPERAGGAARHLCRARHQRGHRLHQVARRHHGRAAAGPHLHQRQPSCSTRG